jgi:hypothetical protein
MPAALSSVTPALVQCRVVVTTATHGHGRPRLSRSTAPHHIFLGPGRSGGLPDGTACRVWRLCVCKREKNGGAVFRGKPHAVWLGKTQGGARIDEFFFARRCWGRVKATERGGRVLSLFVVLVGCFGPRGLRRAHWSAERLGRAVRPCSEKNRQRKKNRGTNTQRTQQRRVATRQKKHTHTQKEHTNTKQKKDARKTS